MSAELAIGAVVHETASLHLHALRGCCSLHYLTQRLATSPGPAQSNRHRRVRIRVSAVGLAALKLLVVPPAQVADNPDEDGVSATPVFALLRRDLGPWSSQVGQLKDSATLVPSPDCTLLQCAGLGSQDKSPLAPAPTSNRTSSDSLTRCFRPSPPLFGSEHWHDSRPAGSPPPEPERITPPPSERATGDPSRAAALERRLHRQVVNLEADDVLPALGRRVLPAHEGGVSVAIEGVGEHGTGLGDESPRRRAGWTFGLPGDGEARSQRGAGEDDDV